MSPQFDRLYPVQPAGDKISSVVSAKQHETEEAELRFMKTFANRPSNIGFFESIVTEKMFSKKTVPRVGYFCRFIPEEIIWALGAEPVRLDCGNNALVPVGEEALCGGICPVAKASFGMFMMKDSLASSCDILLLTAACDAKKKLGEIFSDSRPVFVLNLPPEKNQTLYADFVLSEIFRLVVFLEKKLNVKLSAGKLQSAIEMTKERYNLVMEISQMRMQNPSLLSIHDFYLIIQSSSFYPVPFSKWLSETRAVCREMRLSKLPADKAVLRLLLTGVPVIFPNFKVLNLIHEAGAEVVADTLCSGIQSFSDRIILDELDRKSLLRALLNRSVFASLCPCFISQTWRINRILELLSEIRIDGVLQYSFKSCQLFDMEDYRIEKILKVKGMPYLNLSTDYSPHDSEQLRIRLEAFFEMIYRSR
ncbi:MAG: 2-hydroxyacyl-CoA dehydratase [Candidatus Aureabacteria bacterium]|nr:2-hydroxyacyl-CoA dehydratase [Candidatus Auribacterota bacterium]